jgi:phospholipase/carboxylesterase
MTDEPVVRWRKATHDGAGRPPLLVLLHGRGADENDLFDLSSAIDPAFAVASVRAPIALDEGGYTWCESMTPGRYIATSLRTSIVRMQRWFDTTGGGRPDPQRTYLLGFSAGMAMASALIFDEPARYAGGVLLSGTLPFDTDLSITKNRLADVDIFYGRGTFDTAIPGDLVERTATYLHERSGARLTERTYPIPHAISDAEIADISRWLVACETAAISHSA